MVSRILERNNKMYKDEFDVKHKTGETGIYEGSRVYVKRIQVRKSKLEQLYNGPFRVLKIEGNAAHLRDLRTGKEYKYHQSHLAKIQNRLLESEEGSVNEVYVTKERNPVDVMDFGLETV